MNNESRPDAEARDADLQPLPSADVSADDAKSAEVPTVRCWRCTKDYAGDLVCCPWCRASNRTPMPADSQSPAVAVGVSPSSVEDQIVLLIWFFASLLVPSILMGAINATATKAHGDDSQRVLFATLVAEAIDTIIVVIALSKLPWPVRPTASRRGAWAAWLLALPVLAGMLALNFGYHHLLIEFLHVPRWVVDATKHDLPTPWAVGLICIQPGIVEEAFFRFLTIGTLRRVVQPFSAVWISAVMFGMAHIGAPLSIPYLMLLGLVFGQIYCASGSLILPVLLHMLHNGVIVFGQRYL